MLTIDLNCDLGESFGNYSIGNDEEVIKYVTSVNVACGFHAGDPLVMDKTVKYALEHGVAVGAHPGYPDLIGFGRRYMDISFEEAKTNVMYQVGAIKAFVQAHGGRLQHVKPHGAFYNRAAIDPIIARAIAEGVYAVDPDIILMGLAGGKLVEAGNDVGLRTVKEVFADRPYTKEGTLVSRKEPNSVITDPAQSVAQILNIVQNGKVQTVDGGEVTLEADSICVHGDNAEALALVKYIRTSLENVEIKIAPFREKFDSL